MRETQQALKDTAWQDEPEWTDPLDDIQSLNGAAS